MAAAIAVSAGVFTTLTLLLLRNLLTWRQRVIWERLKAVVDDKPAVHGKETASVYVAKKRQVSLPGMRALGSVFGARYLERIKISLVKAGVPLKPEELAGMSVAGAFAGALTGLVFRHRVLVPLTLCFVGLVWPFLWVNLMKRRRTQRLEGQLVDSLTLIANSLRAGHSFMQALELVSRDMAPPLAPEFGRVLKESRVGLSLDDALGGIVDRFESRDLELAVTGVLIQRQVGGNLAQVLDNIAATIDKRIKARAKIRALTAQGRMSAWVVSLMPFALGFLVFGMYPEFGRVMLVNPLGVAMLGASGFLLVLGIAIIRKVVNVDV